ncbi:MAG TPA: hypothetical protein VHL57_00375, partial [Flavobacteriales bacterium]|nr:hypothetical protein [Flavobacteriales bacterium]
MGLQDINAKRSLLSYAKVQKLISKAIRGNGLFFSKERIKDLKHLNLGCGLHPEPGMVNLDYHWVPGVDVCWDLTKPQMPFPEGRFQGVYTEHCIDGLPHHYFKPILRDLHRILAPGGILRMSFADAEIYCDLYQKRKTDKSVAIPYGEDEATAMVSLNRAMRHPCHTFLFDFETLALYLKEAGFSAVHRRSFRQGQDPTLLVDRPEREAESM